MPGQGRNRLQQSTLPLVFYLQDQFYHKTRKWRSYAILKGLAPRG